MLRFHMVRTENGERKAVFIDRRTSVDDLNALPNDVEIAFIVRRAIISPDVLSALPPHIEQQDTTKFTSLMFDRNPGDHTHVRRLDFSGLELDAPDTSDEEVINENESPRPF